MYLQVVICFGAWLLTVSSTRKKNTANGGTTNNDVNGEQTAVSSISPSTRSRRRGNRRLTRNESRYHSGKLEIACRYI